MSDADDIVDRLREDSVFVDDATLRQAADKIERLRAERDAWKQVALGCEMVTTAAERAQEAERDLADQLAEAMKLVEFVILPTDPGGVEWDAAVKAYKTARCEP